MMSRLAAVVVCGCGLLINAAPPLSPELEPKSSKKFFGKDLPGDKHPPATPYFDFDHPYPGVQDHEDYERDYVKDENTDGGKWEAQMEYDILRQKLAAAEKELARLKEKMDAEAAEMQEAYDKWQEALDKVRAAEARVAEAKKVEAAANATVDQLEDEVKDAAAKVEQEMKDMEACKKALADAKQRLKDLMAKQKKEEEDAGKTAEQRKKLAEAKTAEAKKKLEEQMKAEAKKKAEEAAKKAAEEAAKKAAEEAARKEEEEKARALRDTKYKKLMDKYKDKMDKYHKKMDKYDAKMDKYDSKMDAIAKQVADVEAIREAQKEEVADAIADMKKKDAAWQKKIAQERAEYEAASKLYDQIMQELHETEAALEEAAKNLKKYRRPPHVDNNGGVYNVPESAAAPMSAMAAAVLLAMSF